MGQTGSFFSELRRRNVFRVAVAYAIVGWLLVEVASVVLPTLLLPDWTLRILVFFVILGFPLALFFAWAYELTPEGLKKEKDVDRSQSITRQTGRKLDFAIIGVLVVALGYFVATHDWGGEEPIPVEEVATFKSIAVLPFVNISDDPRNEYFSDGLSEELLNMLAKISDLRVVGRTSSFVFKGKNQDLRTIGEQLSVDHILEGSVRKSGNQVRITAQLVSSADGYHLWSESYDRELGDIFAVQADIASNIVSALRGALIEGVTSGPVAIDVPTRSMEAYQLYLQGQYLLHERGEENLRRSIELFDGAIALDSEFANALTGRAAATWTLPGYSARETEAAAAEEASQFARKALSIDNSLSRAEAVLASISSQQLKIVEGRTRYERAVALAPADPFVLHWYAIHLLSVGHAGKALDTVLKAQSLDPLSGVITGWVGNAYRVLGQYEQAGQYYESAATLGFYPAHFFLADLRAREGRKEEAQHQLISFLKGYRMDEQLAEPFIEAMQDPQRVNHAVEILSAMENQYPTDWLIVHSYATLGDLERAYEVAEAALERGDTVGSYMMWAPYMVEFRRHQRFKSLIEQLRLVEYWDEYGWPEQCHRTGDMFVCQ